MRLGTSVGTPESLEFDTFSSQNRVFCKLRPHRWTRSQNSHLTYARGELRQDACAERSADHASMRMTRCARQNALDKSALGIQDAAIHRIVCSARYCTNRLANKPEMRAIIG